MIIKKIISGGQTGADQAALDAAIKHNIPHGGSIPKGRPTEDGVLPDKYHLEEMSTKSYPKRTEANVVDSDATVVFTHGNLRGGSLLTRKKALEHDKPTLLINLSKMSMDEAVDLLDSFIKENKIEILNVAGSRASKDPLIYEKTFEVMEKYILKHHK
jgi:hypothetical protein